MATKTGGVTELTEEIVDSMIASNELVFLMFHSQIYFENGYFCDFDMFDEVANKIKSEYPQKGKIAFGKASDWVNRPSLFLRFGIGIYSQFKLVCDGQIEKRNYKGDISVKALVEYLRKELEDPIREFQDISDLGTLDPMKRTYIGYFDSKDVPEYNTYRRVASKFKFYCQFRAGFGEVVTKMHPPGQPIIVMRPEVTLSNEYDETFTGSLLSYDQVYEWMCSNYVPVVRKTTITTENVWELSIEGLPMLVLFYKAGDYKKCKKFTDFCNSTFSHLNNKLLILTSDDPNYVNTNFCIHIQNESDLPLVMYRRTDNITYLFGGVEDMDVPGKLEQFVNERVFNKPRDNEEAINITEATIDSIVASNEVVLIMFNLDLEYPEVFDNIPTFNDTAKKIKEVFLQRGRVALVKVDCSKEESLKTRFDIHSFCQFKLIRNGHVEKRNYEGEVTVEALVAYIKKELEDPVIEIQDINNLGILDPDKRIYIGYFESKDIPEYDVFRRAASNFKYYCHFKAVFGELVEQPTIVMRPEVTLSDEYDETFTGSLLSYDQVYEWMLRNYIPVVRKIPITWENRKDFYKEQLPLVVLLHKPEDEENVKTYSNFCQSNFMHLKNNLLFVTSDDEKCIRYFTRNSRKPELELPVIVYENNFSDIFNNYVYIFGNIQEMEIPKKFEQFLIDHIANKPRDSGEAPNVTEATIDSIIECNETVFIMFYMGSYYPSIFKIIPNFNAVARKIKEDFPSAGQVALVKVECEKEDSLKKKFCIYEYPTYKVIYNGRCMKRELKFTTEVEKLIKFVKKEMEEYMIEFKDINDLGTLDPQRILFIGYFDHKDVPEYHIFRQVARVYKNNCQFRVGFGHVVAKMHPPGQSVVVLRPDITSSTEQDRLFPGSILNYDELNEWMCEHDLPLVRRTPITCENEVDFLPENKSMLILFHKPEDKELVKKYTNICESVSLYFRSKLLFLTSVDEKYALKVKEESEDKQTSDIPFIGFYDKWQNETFIFCNIKDIEVPGKIEKFIDDHYCRYGLFD